MSNAEDLKRSVQNEYEHWDKTIKKIKLLADLIPNLEERKKEAKAKMVFVNNMPLDFLEEISPNLIQIQIADENKIANFKMDDISISASYPLSNLSDTSGSISSFDSFTNLIKDNSSPSEAVPTKITQEFQLLADEKAKKLSILENLRKINIELEAVYIQVNDNYIKCLNGIMNINQVAMDMREIIRMLWGELSQIAKTKHPENFNFQHNQHKTENHRIAVAKSLSNSFDKQHRIQRNLKIMYDLTIKISSTDFGKYPLAKDMEKLKEIRTSFVIQIDQLMSLIKEFLD